MIGLHSDSGAEMAFKQRYRIRSSTLSVVDTQGIGCHTAKSTCIHNYSYFFGGRDRCEQKINPVPGEVGVPERTRPLETPLPRDYASELRAPAGSLHTV